MALKIKVNLKDIQNYPNIFMLEDLLVINIIKTETSFVFMGISNSMYKDIVVSIEEDDPETDGPPQTIDIQIPNSLEELNQLQLTLKFAFHLFANSSDTNQQELSTILSPKIATYNKKVQIQKLQELL